MPPEGRRPDAAARPAQTAKAAAVRARDVAAGRDRFLEAHVVSRETLDSLDIFVSLVLEWQAKTNLVAPSTLPDLWTRHIADSLHLHAVAPAPLRWADLGSGGGFPGIVTAILQAERPGAHVDLVESNAKKAAFLRAAVRATAIPATVHAARIEACGDVLRSADAVSARALASLDILLGLVAGRLQPGVPCYFMKGRRHDQEIVDAAAHWRFRMVKHVSTIEAGAAILEISDIEPLA